MAKSGKNVFEDVGGVKENEKGALVPKIALPDGASYIDKTNDGRVIYMLPDSTYWYMNEDGSTEQMQEYTGDEQGKDTGALPVPNSASKPMFKPAPMNADDARKAYAQQKEEAVQQMQPEQQKAVILEAIQKYAQNKEDSQKMLELVEAYIPRKKWNKYLKRDGTLDVDKTFRALDGKEVVALLTGPLNMAKEKSDEARQEFVEGAKQVAGKVVEGAKQVGGALKQAYNEADMTQKHMNHEYTEYDPDGHRWWMMNGLANGGDEDWAQMKEAAANGNADAQAIVDLIEQEYDGDYHKALVAYLAKEKEFLDNNSGSNTPDIDSPEVQAAIDRINRNKATDDDLRLAFTAGYKGGTGTQEAYKALGLIDEVDPTITTSNPTGGAEGATNGVSGSERSTGGKKEEREEEPKFTWEADSQYAGNRRPYSIFDAYHKGFLDEKGAQYYTIDAISNFFKNLGRNVGNVGAQFTGGTIDNTEYTSAWDKAMARMDTEENQKWLEGMGSEASRTAEGQRLANVGKRLLNESEDFKLSAARTLKGLIRDKNGNYTEFYNSLPQAAKQPVELFVNGALSGNDMTGLAIALGVYNLLPESMRGGDTNRFDRF